VSYDEGIESIRNDLREGFAEAQKRLPPKYFYDERGSHLFDEITRLPEYYLTRIERGLLRNVIPEIVGVYRPTTLSELGAGAASKTRIILDAMIGAGCGQYYHPIDLSAEFLTASARSLEAEYSGLCVEPVVADFTRWLPPPTATNGAVLHAFLGSTLGNLELGEAIALLSRVRTHLRGGDRFLLGVDLQKSVEVIEAAYNDSRGVTAEFNLNILRVMNRELGADFDLDAYRHHAFYDPMKTRVEMHLISERRQRVYVPKVGAYEIEEGESIRTEISRKYDRDQLETLLCAAGLELEGWWTDPDTYFALVLAAPR